MNYNALNQVAEYIEKEIYPLCKPHSSDFCKSFDTYINRVCRSNDGYLNYNLLSLHFAVSPVEFLKHYQNKLMYVSNTSDPNLGMMVYTHQISPTFHSLSRLYCWVENHVVYSHLFIMVAHNNFDEFVEFSKECRKMACSGNTEENHSAGFKFS
jgi:hypothetical protein